MIGIPGYVLYKLLPFLIEMATNVIILGAEIGLIVIVVMAIVSNWNSIVFGWKNISRAQAGLGSMVKGGG